MRRTVRAVLLAVGIGGVLFLFVLPGRTWLSQDRAMSVTQHRSGVLSQENLVLKNRVAQLQNPSDIEQIARQQYGLVLPGEEAYGILPQVATTTTVPATPPTTKGR